MNNIQATSVHYAYRNKKVFADLNLTIADQKLSCIMGANGSGKSTLLKLLAGLLTPLSGQVLIDNIPIHQLLRKTLAKKLSYLPQQCRIPESLTVWEYVALGRFCHQSWFSTMQNSDILAVEEAIAMTYLEDLSEQVMTTLSAGQQQRARIALMLAQQAPYLLLDEPMTGLDIKQQQNILELLSHLQKQHNKTIVVILHDLQQALTIADEIILLKSGNIIAQGLLLNTLTPENLSTAFSGDIKIS
jgi:iron complex transport system ATP-binding protein